MTSNPYQSPSTTSTLDHDVAKTIQVDRFPVNTAAFACSFLTPEGFSEALHREISACCHHQGMDLNGTSEPYIQITGAIHAVDEGDQLQRYLIPLLGGGSLVHVEGAIHIRNEQPHLFKHVLQTRVGILGGHGKTIIRSAMQRLGTAIAAEASCRCSPETVQQDSKSVSLYFWCVALAALFFSAIVAGLGYYWAHSLDPAQCAFEPKEIPVWVGVVAISAFTMAELFGTAFAPGQVLRSKEMVWLVTRFGTRSLAGVRGSLIFLAVLAGAVLAVCFVIAT